MYWAVRLYAALLKIAAVFGMVVGLMAFFATLTDLNRLSYRLMNIGIVFADGTASLLALAIGALLVWLFLCTGFFAFGQFMEAIVEIAMNTRYLRYRRQTKISAPAAQSTPPRSVSFQRPHVDVDPVMPLETPPAETRFPIRRVIMPEWTSGKRSRNTNDRSS